MEIIQDVTTVEQMLMDRACKNKVPINGSMELLPLCNMNCDMCYVRLTREEMESKGHLLTLNEWLKIAEKMQNAGVLFLLLTGGEPFLYPEFRELYLELQKMGFIITINTNGTLIDEEMARFLGRNRPRRVNITVYGAEEETYRNLCHYPAGYEKTMVAINLLRKYQVDVKINGSLSKGNLKDIDKILNLAEELEIPVNIDTYMMPAVRERTLPFNEQSRVEPEKAANVRMQALLKKLGKEKFEIYAKEKFAEIEVAEKVVESGEMSCYAGKCSFSVNWQGELRPCVILEGPAMSVLDYDFEEAWKYITEETSKIRLNKKCSSCRLRPLCRTCAASGLLEAGAHDAVPEYMCRYAKRSYEILKGYTYAE